MNTQKLLCAFALGLGISSPAQAQSQVAALNQNAITLLAGEAQWMPSTLKLTQLLQHRDGLRILPMQGDGCISAVADVMQLAQVDAAVLRTDCVDYVTAQGLLPGSRDKLVYIARMESLPLLLVTRKTFPTLTSLAGKRIATGPAHSANFAAGELLLGDMGLPFVRVAQHGPEALAALTSGTADAVLMTGTSGLAASLNPKEFHVLGLVPPGETVAQYAPALVPLAQLGGLATSDVETVAPSLVLAAYDWQSRSAKAEKINRLAAAYVAATAQSAGASELSARVPGWKRHPVAEKALQQLSRQQIKETTAMQIGGTP